MGNNLKLRNHSRELITGPHACPLARCTSRRPHHVHVVHWTYFRLWRRRPRKKRSRSIPFSPISLSYADDDLHGVDQRACYHVLQGFCVELAGCLPFFSYCGLLRTDCCVFLSSNRPDRRSRPPIRRRYRSSSRVCFLVPPFLVRHTGNSLLSTRIALEVCDARRGFLSLSLYTLSALVLDFSLER